MGLITEKQLKDRVQAEIRKSSSYAVNFDQKARAIINETRIYSNVSGVVYDIFLSHSSDDAEKVAGLKLVLEDFGYKVYVDWIEDPLMNRQNVTKATAEQLQQRMRQSAALIYAFSENASNSKWMPWELGYFDGIKGLVAVLPIAQNVTSSFKGSEYLGIYPYVDLTGSLYIHEDAAKYISFNSWIKNERNFK